MCWLRLSLPATVFPTCHTGLGVIGCALLLLLLEGIVQLHRCGAKAYVRARRACVVRGINCLSAVLLLFLLLLWWVRVGEVACETRRCGRGVRACCVTCAPVVGRRGQARLDAEISM